MSKRPDPPGDSPPPPSKRQKEATPAKKQSSLLNFFAKKKEPLGKKLGENDAPKKSNAVKQTGESKKLPPSSNHAKVAKLFLPVKESGVAKKRSVDNDDKSAATADKDAPIIPHQVKPEKGARWKVLHNCLLVRTVPTEEPRTKVASFDLDGTLLVWRIAGWPSQYQHYELWNATGVASKFRTLHDEGYKLVIFSNQGAIRSAVTGKKASFMKSLIEWLATSIIQRPLHVCMSTDKKKGYHKPNPGMWNVCEQECNQGVEFDLENSFFVGDSVGDDNQGGVDEAFAKNIGLTTFYEPQDYFGPSDAQLRKKQGAMQAYSKPPAAVLEEHAALLGGYHLEAVVRPIVLVLCGVQGSGKSTFCEKLINDGSDANTWVVVSQDTINKGKPGKREQVEEATRSAIKEGKSVVVDRMHLNKEQRGYFVDIAKDCKVKVHAVLLRPSKDVITKRVKERTNHPGKVEGEKGVRIALRSLETVVVPTYEEGFDLVSCTATEEGVVRLSRLYGTVSTSKDSVSLASTLTLSNGVAIPSVMLGTMGLGKRKAVEVIPAAIKCGYKGVDTAPTYKNESEVGKGLKSDTFVVIKVPKRATQPNQVRAELNGSLSNLGRECADLLLLHWPCDVIEAGTLQSVWQEMEKCVEEGLCRSLGVCNFSVDALRQLIPLCKIPPCVNQVERHPLLPQTELLMFCASHDIAVQAHTPLGQGKIELLENSTILEIAKEAGLSSAQVVLLWNLRQGVAVVPKATSEDHLKQAIKTLDGSPLTGDHLRRLNSISQRMRFVAPPFMYGLSSYCWGSRK